MVASSIDDGGVTGDIEDLSEPQLYELIVDYIRSEKLRGLDDEGMAQLLLLDDNMLSDLLSTDTRVVGVSKAASLGRGDATSAPFHLFLPRTIQMNNDPKTFMPCHPHHRTDMSMLTHLQRTEIATCFQHLHGMPAKNLATPTPAKTLPAGVVGSPLGRVSLSSSMGDQVPRFNDVAALLPHREFRVHGGQISDVGSEISYRRFA